MEGLLLYITSKLIQLGLWYHIMCVVEWYVHIYIYIYIYNLQHHTK